MKKFFYNSKVLISSIILYPLLFIWQGLDFTDSGYLVTNYQQFFHDPASISTSMSIWLTNLIGGVWNHFFGDSLGLWGMKLAGVFIIYVTIFFAYLILKPYLKKEDLLIGLLLSTILIFRWPIIHYNNLTVLFFIIGAHFLIEGLKNSKNHWLYFTGIILGLNIFIRFPNVMGFLLMLGIFFYGYINKNPLKTQAKQAFYFITGYITAIILSLLMIKIFGHYDFYMESLKSLSVMVADKSSMYGIMSLINLILTSHIEVFLYLFLLSTIIYSLMKMVKQKNKFLDYLIFILCIILMLISIRKVFVGVLYLILLFYQFREDHKEFRLISLLSLLIIFLTPLGSGAGLHNAIYAMWLAIPIAYQYFIRLNENSFSSAKNDGANKFNFKLKLGQTEISILKNLILCSFIIFSLGIAFAETYRDTKNRFAMTYLIKHPLLKAVFTTRERAEVVQELLVNLSRYVNKDDYLIADEETAMVHFLTKTKPYLYNPWPMLYSPPQYKKILALAITEKPDLPVIVRAKASVANTNWPKVTGLRASKRHDGNRAIMNEFIEQNQYKIGWENRFFQILLPPKSKK